MLLVVTSGTPIPSISAYKHGFEVGLDDPGSPIRTSGTPIPSS